MGEVAITAEVLDEMPDLKRESSGKWLDLVRPAAEDGKVRKLTGIPADDLDKVRRQLSHTAGQLRTEQYPDGAGIRTVTSDGALLFQVTTKRDVSSRNGKAKAESAKAAKAAKATKASA